MAVWRPVVNFGVSIARIGYQRHEVTYLTDELALQEVGSVDW